MYELTGMHSIYDMFKQYMCKILCFFVFEESPVAVLADLML